MAKTNGLRIGIYADVENIVRNGGRACIHRRLGHFACRDGAEPCASTPTWPTTRPRRQDADYRYCDTRYHIALRNVGFKVIEKPVQWYTNEEEPASARPTRTSTWPWTCSCSRASSTGWCWSPATATSRQVVRAVLQNVGCRVEVVALPERLVRPGPARRDVFISGYLIPGLLPPGKGPAWGEVGRRVRGTCCGFREDKGYGFLQFYAGPTAENPEQREFFDRAMPADFDYALLPQPGPRVRVHRDRGEGRQAGGQGGAARHQLRPQREEERPPRTLSLSGRVRRGSLPGGVSDHELHRPRVHPVS